MLSTKESLEKAKARKSKQTKHFKDQESDEMKKIWEKASALGHQALKKSMEKGRELTTPTPKILNSRFR